jgi:peptidoglycan/xylan/chitin deacetylase (PgdA/CDA1 family)
MYFSKNNNFFHGIMFYHFYDDKLHTLINQGSISQDDFYKLIKFMGRTNILNAKDFLLRFKENRLTSKNLCLTFDDCLRCQYDIALPVLEDLDIKSFFFVQSSVFTDNPDLLEVYRYFRMKYFKNVDEFYSSFFNICDENLDSFFAKKKNVIEETKQKFSFYSINDIKFRLVRDDMLNENKYQEIMLKMFEQKKFNYKESYDILYMSKSNLIKIKELGHIIGLHSHTHPTKLEKLNYDEQLKQYTDNLNAVSEILNCQSTDIVSMSHPNGSYNSNTLKILEKLGIELGFKQIMTLDKNMKKINNSSLEIARQDHTNIIKSFID